MNLNDVKQKALAAIAAGSGETATIYLLERIDTPPTGSEINRLAGVPLPACEGRWPEFGGDRMAHALTLDLETAPALKKDFPDHIRAVALFVSDLDFNEAYEPWTPESKVLLLSRQECEQRTSSASPVETDEWDEDDYEYEGYDRGASTFKCHELQVPVEVFAGDLFDREPGDPIYSLHEELVQTPFAGGRPLWLQGREYEKGHFVLQFDDFFLEMNLGDSGVMYVFQETAFWQCL